MKVAKDSVTSNLSPELPSTLIPANSAVTSSLFNKILNFLSEEKTIDSSNGLK